MEGADIYQIAKNCRTSVEMIEKFYAAHIKNMIDASAINIRRERSTDRPARREANAGRQQNKGGFGTPKTARTRRDPNSRSAGRWRKSGSPEIPQ